MRPHYTGLSASWLKDELSSIFGASLIGLWLGEDFAINSTLEITSWPGRVGPTLTYTPNSNGRYTVTQLNGRLAMQDLTPQVAGNQKTLRNTNLGAPPKSLWTFTKIGASVNFDAVNAVVPQAVNHGLMKNINDATWFASPWLTNKNGLQSTDASTDSSIGSVYHAEYSSNATNGIAVGGYYDDVITRLAWPWPLTLAIALSAVPTSIQQIKGVIAVKRFMGQPLTAVELFVRDIVDALGSDLNSMYVVDDADLNGSNQVTLIRSRMTGAGNLSPYLTNYYPTTTTVNGRRLMYAANNTVDGQYSGFPSVSPLVHSVLCVAAVTPLPFPDNRTLYVGHNTYGTLMGSAFSSNWFTTGDIRNYIDSQVDNPSAVTTAGLHLIGGWQVSPTPTADAGLFGGQSGWSGGRNWNANMGCVMQLRVGVEAISASNFQYVLARCKDYYAGNWG